NVKGGDKPDDCGLAGARGTDKGAHRAGRGFKIDTAEHLLARFVREIHIFKSDVAFYAIEANGPARIFILDLFVKNFASAFETGHGFGHLRADRRNLSD